MKPLWNSQTTRMFYDACRAILVDSPIVRLNVEKLEALAPLVAASKRVSWSWYLHKDTTSIADALFAFTFNAALNGGYFEMIDGQIRQWQSKGSGSQALVEWIESLAAQQMRPGLDIRDPETAAEMLAPRLAGQPLAAERLLICAEFADLDRKAALEAMIATIEGDFARDGIYRFTLHHANRLAELYPAAFGADPFRKKAILAIQMFVGWLEEKTGATIAYDLPIPADYQIPRILAWKGGLEISERAVAEIRDTARLLDVDGPTVRHIRAAAVLGAHHIAQTAGVTDDVVDGALFTTFRKDPGFQAESLPPMRCHSLWF